MMRVFFLPICKASEVGVSTHSACHRVVPGQPQAKTWQTEPLYGSASDLFTHRPPSCGHANFVECATGNGHGIVIAGGGLAGQRCAETLRRSGYEQRIRMVCSRTARGRTTAPLSKELLAERSATPSFRFAPSSGTATRRSSSCSA